jgi:hypothetical protein
MYDGVSLGDFLSLIQQNDEVLLQGFPNIIPGFLNGKTVAEAAWQRRAVSQISLIFRFLLDYDLKVVESHALHYTLCFKTSQRWERTEEKDTEKGPGWAVSS